MMIVSCAIVHSKPPEVFLADDIDTLQWVLALEVVARARPERLQPGVADQLRDALLNERWGEAVLTWIRESDTPIDVYPSFDVYEAENLPPSLAAAELQFSPLFQDPPS